MKLSRTAANKFHHSITSSARPDSVIGANTKLLMQHLPDSPKRDDRRRTKALVDQAAGAFALPGAS